MKRKAFPPTVDRYVPIDELLERPRTRILMALRWQDWITAQELNDLFELPGKHEDPRPRNAYAAQLLRLVDEGLVLSRSMPHGMNVYRLAPNVDLSIPPPTLPKGDERRDRRDTKDAPEWVRRWRSRRVA